MTYREDIEGIDAAILMHPRVWEASGHVENFTDPMVDCRECKAPRRAPGMIDIAEILLCPMCGGRGIIFTNPVVDCYDCYGLGKCLTPKVNPEKVVCRPLRDKDIKTLSKTKQK